MSKTKERRAAPRKPKRAPATRTEARAELPRDELQQLIAEAAYYRAERRGFAPGHEFDDWVQAETEVMQRISQAA